MVKVKNNPVKSSLFKWLLFGCSILPLVLNSCEKDISTTQVIEEFPTGSLIIDSYPTKSAIFIDGKNTGYFTPDTITQLELCDHIVTLKNDLWLDYSFDFVPQEENIISYFADFKTLDGVEGTLEITSNVPETKVYINGENQYLITPAVKNGLLPGYYLLEGYKESHRLDSRLVTVRSGTISKTKLVLEDTTHWVSYTKENSDLTEDVINSIVIDHKGNKWLATNNGLIKHSGTSYYYYTRENSGIPTNSINCLLVDAQDNLWVGSGLGLIKFDGQNWTVYNSGNSGLSSNSVLCLDLAPDNKIWIGTLDNGVCNFDGQNWEHFNTANSDLHVNFITAIAVDSKNNVLAGTAGNGLSYYRAGKWLPIISSDEFTLPSSKISAIETDKNDIFWIGHLPSETEQGGLSRFNGMGVSKVNLVGYSGNITNIFADDFGFKWVSTKFGIIRFDENNIPTQLLEMHYKVISGVAAEKEGLYWVSTLGKGIAKYKQY